GHQYTGLTAKPARPRREVFGWLKCAALRRSRRKWKKQERIMRAPPIGPTGGFRRVPADSATRATARSCRRSPRRKPRKRADPCAAGANKADAEGRRRVPRRRTA